MEKPNYSLRFFIFFMVFFTIHGSAQPHSSQSQVLLKVQQILNHPPVLGCWNETTDFCNTDPNPSVTLICYEGNITQFHIIGNSSVPPLAQASFSSDSLFSTLSSLQNLKVLSLVGLGLQGQLSGTIGSLSYLEILNISSNYFTGSIPEEVTSLNNLQTLILDHNNFTGEVPEWLQSSKTPPVLSVLSLRNNSLTGHLPFSLSSLQNLRILDLSMNKLSGKVPDLSSLTNLQVLDLGYNRFGHHFPNLHVKLVTIVLRKNRFTLGIPVNLSHFYQLQKLDISLNRFTGPFPPALLSLPSLSYLDISRNKLTGILRRNTSCNGELAFVNLSRNRLAGELPSCLRGKSRSRVVQYGGNCLSPWPKSNKLNCQRQPAEAVDIVNDKHEKKHPNGAVLGPVLVGGVALFGAVFMVFRKVKNERQMVDDTPKTSVILERVSPAHSIKLLSEARYMAETAKLGSLHLPPYRTFLLEELKEATNNFSSSCLIGEGSCGKVYKGALTDGTFVAIRSLRMRKKHNIQFYTHQIEQISKLRHCHLVSAVGHCFECYTDDSSSVSVLFLVFEFVGDGTLRGCLNDGVLGQKFTWTQRIAAALGVARGIQFLHTGIVPGLFANSLKITDVLLDQDFHVKISKYNLPLFTENRRSESVGDASYPFESKEPNRAIIPDDKDDVYDIGVILLELIFGRSIDSQNAIVVANDLLQVSLRTEDNVARRSIVDGVIQKECCDASLKVVMEICVRCLSTDRPSVEDVLWNLQFAAQLQDL